MLARQIISFLWGAGLASVWWAAARFGYGEAAPLWIVPVAGTVASVALIAVTLISHIDDK